MKLLLATHNPAKIKELTKGLRGLRDIQLLSLKDSHIADEPDETGTTFAENSVLKAKYYAHLAKMPVIADDGGIAIDVLDGEPGVRSKMWLGRSTTDKELIEYALTRLQNVPREKRTARMELVLTFYDPKANVVFAEKGGIEGRVAEKITSNFSPGFPFRALFIVNKYNKYYDELTDDEHHHINHRLQALNRLIPKITNYFARMK